jgi:hypothetical protein
MEELKNGILLGILIRLRHSAFRYEISLLVWKRNLQIHDLELKNIEKC